MPGRQVGKQAWHATYTLITLSRYSKLVYIIMFRISRYALAHSFVHKHRFHRSRSPLRSLFNLCFCTKYCTNSYQLILNTYLNNQFYVLRL